MFRFLLGMGVGAALVYYLDTERGATRRTKTNAWVRQYVNPDTLEQARQTTVSQARNLGQQLSQQAGVVTDRVSQYRSSHREDVARPTQPGVESAVNSAKAGANI